MWSALLDLLFGGSCRNGELVPVRVPVSNGNSRRR